MTVPELTSSAPVPPLPPIISTDLARQVYTHGSANSIDNPSSYTRLAFVGRAALALAIAKALYENNKCFECDELNKLKAKYESNGTFTRWGNLYGLEEKIVVAKPLVGQRQQFVGDVFAAHMGALSSTAKNKQGAVDQFIKGLIEPELNKALDTGNL